MHSLCIYSLRFKIKVMYGHKSRYGIKVTFGGISLKLRQTNWNVARNNVKLLLMSYQVKQHFTLV
jgi:hypothetical protein